MNTILDMEFQKSPIQLGARRPMNIIIPGTLPISRIKMEMSSKGFDIRQKTD